MTTPKLQRTGRSPGRPKKQPPVSLAQDMLVMLSRELEAVSRVRFPSPRYRLDPVAFFREILGVEPWSRQVEILEAVRDYPRVAIRSGHKVSKLLALDTEVPTPSGWTTIGDLRPGDQVFDETGQVRNVLGLSEITTDSACFAVEFDDGTKVVTDATHAWKTWTHRERKRADRGGNGRHGSGELATTEEIARTLNTVHAGRNHAVVVAGAVVLPERDLPIDPYLLGVWLGDGSSAAPNITTADPEIEQAFRDAGHSTRSWRKHGNAAWTFAVDPPGRGKKSPFTRALCEIGVLRLKHVPDSYLRSSAAQRMALLQGLMDTDGCCTGRGRAMFSNTNVRIARDVFELAASLSLKPHWGEHRAKLDGVDCGPVYIVGMVTTEPLFRLARKRGRQHSGRTKSQWTRQRMIVAVRPVESVPVRCIEVDSPSHLFLITRSFIPTHNSNSVAGIALWFYCSFDSARVVLSSTTDRQVNQILWRELRMLRARGGRCVPCKLEIAAMVEAGIPQMDAEDRIPRPCDHSGLIDDEPGELARTGLKSRDFREIVGFTAREAEAVAGISGHNLLYLLDEASGIPDLIFEAIEGNRAGGARIVLTSNPTRNEGEFYEAFASKSNLYHTITISSEETPNAVSGKMLIPGLATREWIEEKCEEWGENSPLYKIRVKGEHALHEEGRIFSVHEIGEAERRWHDQESSGRLYIGVDPAGPQGTGDESTLVPRRGLKVIEISHRMGLSPEGHLVQLLGLIKRYKLPRETPVVVLDPLGDNGDKVLKLLRAHAEENPGTYELVSLRSSDKAVRQPHVYDRIRDELTANLLAWITDGGAIPEDAKLEREMHAMEWRQHANGKVKVTAKDQLRKVLGRSPDRYDALALACWEPLSLREGVSAEVQQKVAASAGDVDVPDMDPYAGADAWRPR